MYTVRDFGEMIADRVRMGAYEEALRQSVKPGSVVVDIGAGTGIFTLLACRFGARKVYAIDPNPAIDVARALVRDNGFRDRVEIIPKMSTEVELPEKADVIVSDVRGVLPTFGSSLSTIIDARSRWLKPGGVLLPRRDELRAAVVEVPSMYESILQPWNRESHYGMDASAAATAVMSNWIPDRKDEIAEAHLLTESAVWATIDYDRVTERQVRGHGALRAARSGTGHGLAVWFDATLLDGVHFSNQPGKSGIHGRAFFPWPSAVALDEGTPIEVDLSAVPAEDDYVFSWTTRIGGASPQEFRQTDFFTRLRMDELIRADDPRPRKLAPEGLHTLRALELLHAGASRDEAAAKLAEAFPMQFPSREAALFAIRAVLRKFT
ncbi:50S ribosomal protein L11 methyltransferase [Pendulispora rubella]|uniref:50S ribosomal protein L11 methyltransferase n=1 Tax=Pendulispora rubella TaxID=2741070 RepID=A0ABZ2LH78_9BACT